MSEQVYFLLERVDHIGDEATISLLANSGLRLSELTRIELANIDWHERLIVVRCKGNKEGLALFGQSPERLQKEWLSHYTPNGTISNLNLGGIIDLMTRLKHKAGLPCNPHIFRLTLASILAERGIDGLHIMRLGRWDSISMVERHTRSVTFEDSLRLYRSLENYPPSMVAGSSTKCLRLNEV